jgi:predicted component of type VI protein secretion system
VTAGAPLKKFLTSLFFVPSPDFVGERLVIKLAIVKGPHMGEEYIISNHTRIGRGRPSRIRLRKDKKVSRQHAEIIVHDKACFIEDLGSTNGTFVAEKPVKGRVRLKNNQIIRVGDTLIHVSWGNSVQASAPSAPSPPPGPPSGR